MVKFHDKYLLNNHIEVCNYMFNFAVDITHKFGHILILGNECPIKYRLLLGSEKEEVQFKMLKTPSSRHALYFWFLPES